MKLHAAWIFIFHILFFIYISNLKYQEAKRKKEKLDKYLRYYIYGVRLILQAAAAALAGAASEISLHGFVDQSLLFHSLWH